MSLLEFDERRNLQKKGKLHLLPLQADDSTSKIANKVRDVFSSPYPSPSIGISESGGEGGGEVDLKEDSKSKPDQRSEPDAEHGSSSREHCPAPASSRPTSEREDRSHDVSNENDQSRPAHDLLRAPQNADSSTQHQEAPKLMGNRGADREHSDDVCSIDRAAPSTNVEDADSLDVNDELLLRHPPLRPGRLPTLRSRKLAADAEDEEATENEKELLTDLDGAIAALNDPEADTFGPLTKESMEQERARSQLDPRQPRRPLRLLPAGQIEKDTPEFKAFRKYALDNNIKIKLVNNPKQPGKESWRRFNLYQPATTLREIIELSTTARNPKVRAEQRKKALDDIIFDSLRGYILYPQHEHNASAHFVDAADLAKQTGTINIHALYSVAEMKAARRAGLKEKHEEIATTLKDQLTLAKSREINSKPLNQFHLQIMSLWEYDKTLQLNDSELKRESAFAAALVQEALFGDIPEPKDYRHAVSLSHPEREKWLESMAQERRTLEDRGTWVLVPRDSIGANKPVKCKYVYRKKLLRDSSIQYKSRLVGCGYSQVAGLNYSVDETYAGVCAYSSLRFLLSLACQKGYIISQTDIQAAYLESYLREDQHVYMEVPPDMRGPDGKARDDQGRELVCKVVRGIYGLKQSGYAWSQCLKEFLLNDPKYNMGFQELTGEPNIYRKTFTLNGKDVEILLSSYVDDLIICSSSEEARIWFMKNLENRLINQKSSGVITKDEPGFALSMHIRYDRERGILQFDQLGAIEALAAKFRVMDSKPKSMPITQHVDLPKRKEASVDQIEYLSIIGSCLHIAQVSRPDIAYAVGVLSRHSATPGVEHMEAALNLVNYLYYTKRLFIQYERSEDGNNPQIYERGSPIEKAKTIEERLVASEPEASPNSPDFYTDADYAGDANTRRSTSGCICMMNGGPISWQSRLQKLVALSSAESEIYAVTDSVKEAIHIKLMAEETGVRKPGVPLVIWEDNTACVHLGHGLRGSKSAKHFIVRLRFLNEHIHDKSIEFAKVDTTKQLADGFTKALGGPAFFEFRQKILKSPDY